MLFPLRFCRAAALCRAAAAAACLLAAAPAWAVEGGAASPPPSDSGAGGTTEAPALDAAEADALFRLGLTAAATSQQPDLAAEKRAALLDEAISAFATILVNEPGAVRVHLELARAFFLKGEDDLARRHFEWVLAGDPPASVAANIRRFLLEMQARRRWSFSLGAALAPDSNIGGATNKMRLQRQSG